MDMIVFRAVGAHSVAQKSANIYEFRTADGQRYEVDLGKCPEWAEPDSGQRWNLIDADDHVNRRRGGATSIPDLAHPSLGVVYASEKFCNNPGTGRPPIKYPSDYYKEYAAYADRRYEFQSLLYSPAALAPFANQRYYGFFGVFLSGSNRKCQIAVSPAGSSLETSFKVTKDFDLTDPSQCHPLGLNYTMLSETNRFGSVFLTCGVASNLVLGLPKLPPVLASLPMPVCRELP